MTIFLRLWSLALSLVLVATPGLAFATNHESAASELKARADRAMDRGDFQDAVTAYREAYARDPSPVFLYNIGRAEEKLGHFAEALTTLEAFEDVAAADLKAKVPRLPALIDRLRSKVARVSVRTAVRGAVVVVRGVPRAATPLLRPLAVAPGAATIEVRADGYQPYRRNVVLEEGKVANVDAALVPAPAGGLFAQSSTADDAPAASTPITKKWWFWTGVGVVLVAGAGAVVALTTEKSAPRGDIEPHQVAAPLLRF